ncbi:hypothetical protein SAMN05216567_110175 [Variovorax sp. OK605]|uniref:hypothetical protein n=1 Tax=Variovorax sp. OK605 TaxID=1855317 RepID=UPI0008F36B76|nr:hypothetical protein [Variovorax sp. OK605]SFQ00365.1 hypothetical protein SAMN05216567_110175 [Variovorax sp. OK605]
MRMTRYLTGCGLAALLAACGGGGGGEGAGGGLPLASGSGNAAPNTQAAAPAPALVKAKAAQGTQGTQDIADARNGTYRVYAANGTQQQLTVDFDAGSYTMTDSPNLPESGTFGEDFTEPGTYVFASGRITTAANTSRFRVTADAIVGAFPFATAYASPVAYAAQPFVAAREFVATAALLDGTYNRFSVTRSPGNAQDSAILSMRLSGSGTVLEICNDAVIYKIDLCPAASKRTYAVASGTDDTWVGTNVANAGDVANFRMARIGGQNVYLAGGVSTAPAVQFMRIGLPESSSWPATRGVGASTTGSWGSNLIDSANSVRTSTGTDGTYASLAMPVGGTFALQPEGIRGVNSGGTSRYFAMQGGALSVLVGSRNPNTQGYLQLNLIDTGAAPDARNGRYKVYASNGTRQALALNLDSKRYEMTDETGTAASGSFSEDAAEAGSFVFDSARIASPVNTARFRLAADTVVGSFPFAVAQVTPVSYGVRPFVASRALVKTQAALDGVYNRLGVNLTAAGGDSSITQIQVASGGTALYLCNNSTIYRIDTCPAATLLTYTVSPGASVDTWNIVNVSNPADRGSFAIARVGNENVYLSAGIVPSTPTTSVFRIGLAERATWPAVTARGGATNGSWGGTAIDASGYARTQVLPGGATGTFGATLGSMGAVGPVNMRAASFGTAFHFASQGSKLFAMVGSRNPATAGALEIGLID